MVEVRKLIHQVKELRWTEDSESDQQICGAPADLCTPAVALTFTSVTQSVCLRPGRRGTLSTGV